MSPVRLISALLTVVAGSLFANSVLSQDWPQIGGPDRNFTAPAATLADAWPDSGQPALWPPP